MTQDEKAMEAIMEILADGGSRTTEEIREILERRETDCSERAVRALMMLRHRGRIVGEFSPERRTWVWSIGA